MHTSFRIGLALVGTLIAVGTHLPNGYSQDFGACSADDVNSALDELGCFADGVYLSPEGTADQVADLCGEMPSERACHFCFMKSRSKLSVAFKALAKIGLLERSALVSLREALQDAEENTCYDLEPTPPENTPPAEETREPNPPPFEPPGGSYPGPTPPEPSGDNAPTAPSYPPRGHRHGDD